MLTNRGNKSEFLMLGGAVILGFFAVLIYASLHSVPTGHKGVEAIFGKVSDRVLDEGIHFLNPLSEVKDVDVREQKTVLNTATYTKDIQMTSLQVVFTYSLEGPAVNRLVKNVGLDYQTKLISPVLEGAIKNIVGKWEADQLISNRNTAIDQMTEFLQGKLNKEYIRYVNFQLTGINYSEAFEKSIEEKQIATQNAIKAKNNTVRVQEEARQQIISAEAEARAMKIKSDALRTNKSLIEYEAVQKWDGKLPTYTGGGAMPFLNINNK